MKGKCTSFTPSVVSALFSAIYANCFRGRSDETHNGRKLPQKNANVVNWKGVGVSLELKQISCNMPISVVEFVSS